jgi:hypothetical protein
VLSVAAFLISIVSTKPATSVTRMFVAVFTVPPHAAIKIFECWSQVVSKSQKANIHLFDLINNWSAIVFRSGRRRQDKM